jgi:hypothetical protein
MQREHRDEHSRPASAEGDRARAHMRFQRAEERNTQRLRHRPTLSLRDDQQKRHAALPAMGCLRTASAARTVSRRSTKIVALANVRSASGRTGADRRRARSRNEAWLSHKSATTTFWCRSVQGPACRPRRLGVRPRGRRRAGRRRWGYLQRVRLMRQPQAHAIARAIPRWLLRRASRWRLAPRHDSCSSSISAASGRAKRCVRTAPYLCRGPSSSARGVSCLECGDSPAGVGSPSGRCSVAGRTERVALDGHRAGAGERWVRVDAQPYLGPRPGLAPGRRHDG